jgi:hypothetical protein
MDGEMVISRFREAIQIGTFWRCGQWAASRLTGGA